MNRFGEKWDWLSLYNSKTLICGEMWGNGRGLAAEKMYRPIYSLSPRNNFAFQHNGESYPQTKGCEGLRILSTEKGKSTEVFHVPWTNVT